MSKMTQSEVKELIGIDTVLKFSFMSDNVMTYKTTIPLLKDGNYIDFEVSLFFESGDCILDYDTLNGTLSNRQIFEVTKLNNTSKEVIFMEQYKELKNES